MGIILVVVGGTWTNSLVDAFYAGTVIAIIVSVVILIVCSTGSAQSVLSVLKHQYIIGAILFIYLLVVSAIMTDRYYTKYHRVGGVSFVFYALKTLLELIIVDIWTSCLSVLPGRYWYDLQSLLHVNKL